MTGVRVKKVTKSLSESLKVLFIISGFSFVIEVIAQYYYLFFEKINRNMLYIQRFLHQQNNRYPGFDTLGWSLDHSYETTLYIYKKDNIYSKTQENSGICCNNLKIADNNNFFIIKH